MKENIRKEIEKMRRDFDYGTLSEEDVPKNPIKLLKRWLNDAVELNITDANAFVLGTCVNNEPDSRVVLIRDIHENGLHFYTNYSSKKGQDLRLNPKASVNIFWADLDRQIRMSVEVEKLSDKTSDAYFKSRPRASQIGAWASNQSSKLKSRSVLEDRIKEIEDRFKGKEVSRPDFWGGFLLKPVSFEFWQGRKSRLHDRIAYEKDGEVWVTKRLYP